MREKNLSLDVVRGAAALLVVLSHARLYLHTAIGEDIGGQPAWAKIALMPTSFGKESVAVFFVLSGLLVGGQVVRQLRRNAFDAPTYAVNRLSRLWSVLVPGLLLTSLVDFAARVTFGSRTNDLTSDYDASPLAWLCNAAFLQQSRCAPYGSNDALWSLSYEFWFYVLFAAAAVAVASFARGRVLAGVAATAVALGAVAAFGLHLLALLPAWLIGVGLAVVIETKPGWLRGRALIPAGLVLAAGGMVVSNLMHATEPVKFILVGVASSPLIAALAVQNPSPRSFAGVPFRALAAVGVWSFSLYVFHLPVVKHAALAVTPGLGIPAQIAAIYLLALVATACTYPLYLCTEKRMPGLRRIMYRTVGRRQPSLAMPAKADARA